MQRLTWLTQTSEATRPVFRFNVLRSTEAPLILEAIDSAESLLRGCLQLHALGALMYCPARVFYRMVRRAAGSLI